MENASKALLMAGSVLISVLIISVFIMVYSNMTSSSNNKEQVLEAEQLAEYNKQWESYNRNNLMGADVISIYNKAIDTNKKYQDLMDNDNFNMITVYFKLKNEITSVEETWKWNDSIKQYTKASETDKVQLDDNTVYNTIDDANKIEDFMTSTDTSKDEEYGYKIEMLSSGPNGHKDYKRIYNQKAAFKLLDFKCEHTTNDGESGLVYDEFGRITQIHLVEI